MFALADINSFYASCEKVFRPDLRNEPVIVLSNNDGCVIARSPEAKALGIRMGQPWFQVRQMRLEKKIHVFSSNYALYHSMSQRVMAVLESLSPAVEPYSIDEMFIDLRGINHCISPEFFGHQLREQVKSWTGLTMGVGIAPTKTLAKSAQWATKQWPQFSGVVALTIRRQLVLPTRANYTGRTLQCDIKSRLLLPSLSFSCSFHLSVRTYIRDGSAGLPPPPP